jgi:hypothetical protein
MIIISLGLRQILINILVSLLTELDNLRINKILMILVKHIHLNNSKYLNRYINKRLSKSRMMWLEIKN